jgi:glucoamylase
MTEGMKTTYSANLSSRIVSSHKTTFNGNITLFRRTNDNRRLWPNLALGLTLLPFLASAGLASAPPMVDGALADPPGRKVMVGSDPSDHGRLVFTGSHGQLDEIFYPQPDRVVNLAQQWLVTAADASWSERESQGSQQLQRPDAQALVWSSLTDSARKRWQIRRRVFVDPQRDVLVQRLSLQPGRGASAGALHWILRNRSLLPELRVMEVEGRTVLLRRDAGGTAMALLLSQPWRLLPASGGVNTDSLLLQPPANATGPLDVTVVMGFGGSEAQAIRQALASLKANPEDLERAAIAAWHRYARGLEPAVLRDPASLLAALVLHAAQDSRSGGIVAGLGTPWGSTNYSLNPNGYHLVWARDLVHSAEALLAAGDRPGANRAADFLFHTLMQQKASSQPLASPGRFPQNAFLDGQPHWNATQLDETALPLLLAWHLDRHDLFPQVKLAADYLAATGPVTQQERWEEMAGYSPSTLAAAIAGLVCAADLAQRAGDAAAAERWLTVADRWRNHVTAWTFTMTGPHGDGRYFVRVDGNGQPDDAERLRFGNGAGFQDVRDIVDGGFLELVRLGVMHPRDWAITASLPELDQVVGRSLPGVGPFWFRYNKDGYGEQNNGNPYAPTAGAGSGEGSGRGRLWPILTAERGIYALLLNGGGAAGLPYLQALRATASPEGMIPEQIWNTSTSVDGWETLTPVGEPVGKANGSIQPLHWAMAASIQLALAVERGRYPVPAVVCLRYGCSDPPAIVTVEAKGSLPQGERLVLMGDDPRLGAGRADAGLPLRLVGGDHWGASVTLSQGRHYRLRLVRLDVSGRPLSQGNDTHLTLEREPSGLISRRVSLTLPTQR